MIGTVASTVGVSIAAAVVIVAVYVSSLTFGIKLVMSDVDRLVFTVEVQGEGELEDEFLYAELHDGSDVRSLEVLPGTVFTFDDLQPSTEYLVRIKNSQEEILAENTFCTTAAPRSEVQLSASLDGDSIVVYVGEIELSREEFYTVVAKDETDRTLFVADDVESQKSFLFNLYEPTYVFVTLSVGGVTLGYAEIDFKSEEAAPLYDYDNIAWVWIDDKATATIPDLNGGDPLVLTAQVTIESIPATCEGDECVIYTAKIIHNDVEYTDVKSETLDGTKFGHDYGEPTFNWSESFTSGYSATALFVCKNDPSHTFEMPAEVSSESVEATCEDDAYVLYSAWVTLEGKDYFDEKEVVQEGTKFDHSYGKATFEWSGDGISGYSATATLLCDYNSDHTLELEADVTTSTIPASCDEEGMIVFTAEVTYQGKIYSDSIYEPSGDSAMGHSYEYRGMLWTPTDDGYSAEGLFVCIRDESHTMTIPAEVVFDDIAPTCEEDGYIAYIATVYYEEEHSDKKIVVSEGSALGHDYSATFDWRSESEIDVVYTSVIVTLTCSRNEDHTIEVEVYPEAVEYPQTCMAVGYTDYTVKFVYEGVEYNDSRTVEGDAPLEHDFALEPVFEWNSEGGVDYSAVACFTCQYGCGSYYTIDADITGAYVESPPYAYTEYTAHVIEHDVEYTDVKKVYDMSYGSVRPVILETEVYGVGESILLSTDGSPVYFADDYGSQFFGSGTVTIESINVDIEYYKAEIIFIADEMSAWMTETGDAKFFVSVDITDSTIVGIVFTGGDGDLENRYSVMAVYGYEVTFMTDENEPYYSKLSVRDGDTFVYPPKDDPTKAGYIFGGWCLKDDNGNMIKVDFDELELSGETFLWANWILASTLVNV